MTKEDKRVTPGEAKFVWHFMETKVMVAAAGLIGFALGALIF